MTKNNLKRVKKGVQKERLKRRQTNDRKSDLKSEPESGVLLGESD